MSWADAFSATADTLERGPQAAPPATLGEIVSSNWDAAGLRELTGASQPWEQAEGDLRRGIEAEGGKGIAELAQAQGVRLDALGWGGSTAEARAAELNRLALGLEPQAQEKLKPLLDVGARARQIRADRERKAADVSERTYGLADNALAFGVGMARSMVEPVNLASMAVGNPFAGSVRAMLLRETALGAGVQALQEPMIAAQRHQLGAEVSFGESLGNIAMAGLGNAAGAGMLRAGAWALRGFRRAGEVRPAGEAADPVLGAREDRAADLDALARFAERDEMIGAIAPDPTPAGRAVHAEAVELSLAALDDGRAGLSARIEAEGDLALRRVDPELSRAIEGVELRRSALQSEIDRAGIDGFPGGRQALDARIAVLEGQLDGIANLKPAWSRPTVPESEIRASFAKQAELTARDMFNATPQERLAWSDERAAIVQDLQQRFGVADSDVVDRLLRSDMATGLLASEKRGLIGEAANIISRDLPEARADRNAARVAELEQRLETVVADLQAPGILDPRLREIAAEKPPARRSSPKAERLRSEIAGLREQAARFDERDATMRAELQDLDRQRADLARRDEAPSAAGREDAPAQPEGEAAAPSPASLATMPAEPREAIARRLAREADIERVLRERGGDLDLVLPGETISVRALLDDVKADATAARALKDCLGGGL